jgi:spore coat polysaccharide biosynthesis protein SpsF
MKTGVIIQARVGSTRLPFKTVLPFNNTRSIIEIILEELIKHANGIPMVLATTTSGNDDVLCRVAENLGIDYFRGPEQDVLGRFIQAAEHHGFERIVRICADNPLLDGSTSMKLLKEDESYDYVAYRLKGDLPSIKSHLGLWGEVVRVDALKKVKLETSQKLYYEHVTNFIYGHPEKFNIKWLDAPAFLFDRKDIRLTIDDENDFNMIRKLLSEMREQELPLTSESVVSFLDKNPVFLDQMRSQIKKYTK